MCTPLDTVLHLWASQPALVFEQVPFYAEIAREDGLYNITVNYVDAWPLLQNHVNDFWLALARHVYEHCDDRTFPYGMSYCMSWVHKHNRTYCISLPVKQCGYVKATPTLLFFLPSSLIDNVILPFLLPPTVEVTAEHIEDDHYAWVVDFWFRAYQAQ